MTFLTASKVAERIGFASAMAFLQARARLERDTLFPQPMPTCRRPMKWRSDAVDAWLQVNGTYQPPQVLPGGNVVLLEEARRP